MLANMGIMRTDGVLSLTRFRLGFHWEDSVGVCRFTSMVYNVASIPGHCIQKTELDFFSHIYSKLERSHLAPLTKTVKPPWPIGYIYKPRREKI